MTISNASCKARAENSYTSPLEGIAWKEHTETVATRFLETRTTVAQGFANSLLFDMENKVTMSAERYLIFRFPVLPTSGINRDLSPAHGSDEYLELSDKVCYNDAEPLGSYRHGIIPERMLSIIAEGGMRPSKTNIKLGLPGVYATVPNDWNMPLGYSVAVPLWNNGIFYQFVVELKAPKVFVKHNRKLGTDHVLDARHTRIAALSHSRDWKAGEYIHARQAWDPHLEYHPKHEDADPVANPVCLDPLKRVEQVNEMLRRMEAPSSPDFDMDNSLAAILTEFEALRDDQGVLTCTHAQSATLRSPGSLGVPGPSRRINISWWAMPTSSKRGPRGRNPSRL